MMLTTTSVQALDAPIMDRCQVMNAAHFATVHFAAVHFTAVHFAAVDFAAVHLVARRDAERYREKRTAARCQSLPV